MILEVPYSQTNPYCLSLCNQDFGALDFDPNPNPFAGCSHGIRLKSRAMSESGSEHATERLRETLSRPTFCWQGKLDGGSQMKTSFSQGIQDRIDRLSKVLHGLQAPEMGLPHVK